MLKISSVCFLCRTKLHSELGQLCVFFAHYLRLRAKNLNNSKNFNFGTVMRWIFHYTHKKIWIEFFPRDFLPLLTPLWLKAWFYIMKLLSLVGFITVWMSNINKVFFRYLYRKFHFMGTNKSPVSGKSLENRLEFILTSRSIERCCWWGCWFWFCCE